MIDFSQALENGIHFLVADLLVRTELSPAQEKLLVRILFVAGSARLRFKLCIVLLSRMTFVIDFKIVFLGSPADLTVILL